MIAVDSSVAVAACATWHTGHVAAAETLRRKPHLPAHAAVETYAVLTRLPAPHRVPPDVAAAFIERNFGRAILELPGDHLRQIISECPSSGIVGGAVFDAVVAATAHDAGATLITRDLRARRTYDVIGVRYEILE